MDFDRTETHEPLERREAFGSGEEPVRQPAGRPPRDEDAGSDVLSAYLRSIGHLKVLSPEETNALAEAMEREEAAFRRALAGIPGTAALLAERWRERRDAGLVTGVMAARCRDGSGRDWSRHIDHTLGAVAALLEQRRALRARPRPSRRRRAELDEALAARVEEAEVDLELLLEIHRHYEALLAAPHAEGADEKRRLGLNTPAARAALRRAARALEAYHAAKQTFVTHNLRLVVSAAKRYRNMGIAFSDLLQEGNLGLIRAVEKYDRHRGYRFSTYGIWWINQALIRVIQNHSRTVRTPSHIHELRYTRRRAEAELRQRLGRDPTRDELAEVLDVTPETLQRSVEAAIPETSLHAVMPGTENRTLEEVLEDPEISHPSEEIEHEQRWGRLERELESLDERERCILQLRYGLGGESALTLEQIGKRLGISRERVRQIEARVLRSLRERDAIQKLVA